MTIFLIAIGGFLGAISRYWTANMFRAFTKLPTYSATLTVNLIGSFLLGIVLALHLHAETKLFFGIGFLGSFTTFSTFVVENMTLAKENNWRNVIMYILISVIGGVILAFIGMIIGKLLLNM
ncbi:fluoride efflux transporter CrcB [Lederbergia lenta]|uniref:Fluoride-specific ion channel FluC n=1 Tax=Lederbergia lenta TaxID=1467 RepID=A0A2X4W8V1_LEDLE|nr:fluoride efflux transporter CrcB [Lederbergia lenta]MEC2324521.1 fluoride efflux transporter CrcB [Lederbergia lenta]SQI59601.1 camphor resistance protein CrcB [Lederbergia lenta]